LLILLPVRMALTGGSLVIVLGSMVMKESIVMQDVLISLRCHRMAVASCHLHRDSSSQRAAAEQWQPNSHEHRNKLFKREKHKSSLS